VASTEDCKLDGSHHVKNFKLDERFNLAVRITFNWKDENGNTSGTDSTQEEETLDTSTIFANGNILLEVLATPPSLQITACDKKSCEF
jgi:hypothetical protein